MQRKISLTLRLQNPIIVQILSAVMKVVKPLVMQLHKYYNIPYADILNQVEDCKWHIGTYHIISNSKKVHSRPFQHSSSFCLLKSEGPKSPHVTPINPHKFVTPINPHKFVTPITSYKFKHGRPNHLGEDNEHTYIQTIISYSKMHMPSESFSSPRNILFSNRC